MHRPPPQGSAAIPHATHLRVTMLSIFALGALALLLVLATPARSQTRVPVGISVVVNAANPLEQLDRDQLSNIFLKRVAQWPNGAPADPVDLAPSLLPRAIFSMSVHKRSVGAVLAFWQQQIFSGRDVPPVEKRSEQDIIDYVAEHVEAVGYVSAATELPPSVKIIQVRGAKP